jgi:hypothetical protein
LNVKILNFWASPPLFLCCVDNSVRYNVQNVVVSERIHHHELLLKLRGNLLTVPAIVVFIANFLWATCTRRWSTSSFHPFTVKSEETPLFKKRVSDF